MGVVDVGGRVNARGGREVAALADYDERHGEQGAEVVFFKEWENDRVKIKVGVVEGEADAESVIRERLSGQHTRVVGRDVREMRIEHGRGVTVAPGASAMIHQHQQAHR
jgi:hypothetical protein